MTRRSLLLGGAAALAGAGAISAFSRVSVHAAEMFEFTRTDEEWRRLLTPEQYDVCVNTAPSARAQAHSTASSEPAPFLCAACDLAGLQSADKFDSGTGWPSFTQPIEGAIGTSEDPSWFSTRTEVHCRRCGGHLGHVFDDGPKPTGLRYCMNGVAMKFAPTAAVLRRCILFGPAQERHR